jgi:mannose-6-phosphate isomerase-like protein (cupin superfamily)
MLVRRSDLLTGRLQTVNWAISKPQRAFSKHLHENLTEVFIIVSVRAEIHVDQETDVIGEGDAAVIPHRTAHIMAALDGRVVRSNAAGVSHGAGERTILVKS